MQLTEGSRDRIACENTLITEGSAVQQGCGLVVVNRDTHAVLALSEGLHREFGGPDRIEAIFSDEDADEIRNAIGDAGGRIPAHPVTLRDGRRAWAGFFDTEGRLGIDLTFIDPSDFEDARIGHTFAACVKSLSSEHEAVLARDEDDMSRYFQALVEGLYHLSAFDRVMVYQFDPDMNGTVIAEHIANPALSSFMGLRFPSGDIPKPARDLFLDNKVRQIIDVQSEPQPVLSPGEGAVPFSLDQTNSAFRYTSPVHLEYLANMGVRASLVIGLVVRRKLWGLLSCHHHDAPRQLQPNQLTLCHVLSDLASNHIARLLEKQRLRASLQMREILSALSIAAIGAPTPEKLARLIDGYGPALLDLMQADGFQFASETISWQIGDVPPQPMIDAMDRRAARWKAAQKRSGLVTSDLGRLFSDLPSGTLGFGGMAHLSSWDKKADFKAFRRTLRLTETWAGDPDAKDRFAEFDPEVLHPRNSFAQFRRESVGTSEPWLEGELQACRELHSGLRNIEMSFHKSLRERQLRRSNEQMRVALEDADFQAHHDQLTGIANRRGFERFMAMPARPDGDMTWLCHVDVDHFKQINDSFGHLAGDAVLRHVSHIITGERGREGFAARIGGDEFALILPAPDEVAIAESCKSIQDQLSEPFYFEGNEILVSCTLGVTSFAAGQEPAGSVLSRSDLALYSGKTGGRGRFTFFSPDMEEITKKRRKLEREIEEALETAAFVPYFQPQYCASTGRMVNCEVLLRWQHPTRGVLTPDAFLEVAANMGVVDQIDQSMFKQAVQTQHVWSGAARRTMPLSVNVSVDRLQSPALLGDLQQLGDGASHFTLELLESIYLDNHEVDYGGVVDDLRRTGVGIEIDDFGTGRTSILAVLAVKPDRLKIDQRLIDPIVRDTSARALVRSILEIGDQLGIKAVAEGVETLDHVTVLRDLNCERMQGYCLGKPQSADHIRESVLAAVA